MWYEQVEFIGPKHPALQPPVSADFFQVPIAGTAGRNHWHDPTTGQNRTMPDCLRLPDELRQLLMYADGGHIVSGQHDFGYFSLAEIGRYYVEYGFATGAPCLLPVAFDGGGQFYAYDFRNPDQPTVVMVSSGAVSYADAFYLGQNLEDVLTGPAVSEPATTFSDEIRQRHELKQVLIALEVQKRAGQIGLKEYILRKKILRNEQIKSG